MISIIVVPNSASAAEFIIGDFTTSYTNTKETAGGFIQCEQFSALENGNLRELWFRTGSTANTGVTSVWLGVESDSSGKPSGTVLAEKQIVGTPGAPQTIVASGFGLTIKYESVYWLCWLPIGGALHWNAANTSGGTKILLSKVGSSFTKLGEGSTWSESSIGPVMVEGVGTPFSTVELTSSSKSILESVVNETKAIKISLEGNVQTSLSSIQGSTAGSLTELKKLGVIETGTEGLGIKVTEVQKAIEAHGFTELKPLYVSNSGSPASNVEVSDFSTGAQKDLSEFKQSMETVGWCVIGTMIAMMLGFFLFSILRPRH